MRGPHDRADDKDGASVSRTVASERDEPGGTPVRESARPLPLDRTQAILEAAKQVAARLKSLGLPFALAGSVAAYAHGVPVSLQHDVDFCILREDAEAVTEALESVGIEVHTPPEDWLLKARSHGEQIDLIFELAKQWETRELLGRAEILPVDSVRMPVLTPTDLLNSLLAAFSEHHCDFGPVLPIARALREKIDWELLRRQHQDSPMPDAFLYLLERLGVIEKRVAKEQKEEKEE
ncbi:nucleotidyltransferase family protein [Streptomyces sp. NPDC052236]|uniref:nucleotidyltransferase family protein n=1 Tax=Streptomyces sp. NPDC052236 TaxID=3365686 RepID=UPI0037D7806F